jgi:flavoprotein
MLIQGIIMVKIQIDLSDKEDKIVEVYKLMNNLKTKQEAIKEMLKHFEVEIKPKNIKDKDYFKI